jgi:diguanylate cyclase (GGDEF)-like protein
VQDELKRKNHELALINERLKELAVTDELTKLSNRSHFFERLDKEMKRCHRHGLTMTLMLIDLDDFKDVNDTFGHIAGDEVLRDVASVLAGSVRDNDAVGRFGGEEFMAYLVHTSASGAMVPAERVRAAIEGRIFAFDKGTYRTTASIGLATYPSAGAEETRVGFMKRADAALYDAKRSGKNRIAVDPVSV